MNKRQIKQIINNIRNKNTPIRISEILTKRNRIYIIAENRSDKSAIIGSGKVVGELRKLIPYEQVTVLSELDLKNRKIIINQNYRLIDRQITGSDELSTLGSRIKKLIEIEREYPFKNLKDFQPEYPGIGKADIRPNYFQGLDFFLSKKIGLKPDLNSDGIVKIGNFQKPIQMNPLRLNLRYLLHFSWFRSIKLGNKTDKNISNKKIRNILPEVYYGLSEPAQAERKISFPIKTEKIPHNKKIQNRINRKTKDHILETTINNINTIKPKTKDQKEIIDEVLKPLIKIRKEKDDPKALLNASIHQKSLTPIIAYSGGIDSTTALKIMKKYTKPIPVTVGQKEGNKEVKNVKIEKSSEWKSKKQEIIEKGNHPCGKCSKFIKKKIYEYSTEKNNKIVIFGDLISHGSHSIYMDENILRINLPALLSLKKKENYKINDKNFKNDQTYGCSLLNEIHKKNPKTRKLSIRRVLRELRARALDPEISEALIKDIQN